ncbi:hypothetical protein ABW19_dt0206478 [Dactylella cylindrospora]|nr:hypothetical protein ABW19_dt0206478 [Dactylella cylindrospora]
MKAPSILYIGLPPTTKHLPKDGPDPERLANALDQAVKDCTSAGFDTDYCWFEPDELATFESKLKEKNWDAVIIGMGVRGQPSLTAHFERIVNMIREHDANIKLGFNSNPMDTPDAARRLFPAVKPLAAN